MSFKMKTTLI